MKRAHILVSGKVQGVFFRAFAKSEAERLGLSGFVRNLDDGRVEIVAEGDKSRLKDFIEVLRAKHPVADVKTIDARWSEAKNEFADFRILL